MSTRVGTTTDLRKVNSGRIFLPPLFVPNITRLPLRVLATNLILYRGSLGPLPNGSPLARLANLVGIARLFLRAVIRVTAPRLPMWTLAYLEDIVNVATAVRLGPRVAFVVIMLRCNFPDCFLTCLRPVLLAFRCFAITRCLVAIKVRSIAVISKAFNRPIRRSNILASCLGVTRLAKFHLPKTSQDWHDGL